jgi:hypothetical protein
LAAACRTVSAIEAGVKSGGRSDGDAGAGTPPVAANRWLVIAGLAAGVRALSLGGG